VKRCNVLWLGGVLVLVSFVAVCSLPAQSTQSAPLTPIVPLPIGLTPSQPPEPPVPAVPSAQEQPKVYSIDDLLNKLDVIEKQETELKKTKNETLAMLKKKLGEQQQRLKKHGVNVEEGTPSTQLVPLAMPIAPITAFSPVPPPLLPGPR
jgi:hypothetical protein